MKRASTVACNHCVPKLLIGSLLASLLSACAIGPDYRRADVPLSPTFRNAPDTHVVAESAWWRGFEDATLEALIEQSLTNNQDIAVAMARLEQAQAGTRRVRAQQRPVIGIDASVASQHESLESSMGRVARDSPAFERNHEDYAAGLTLNWEIDLFGRLKRQVQAATARSDATRADLLGLKIAIAAETADAYLSWRQAHEAFLLLEQRIAARAMAVELTQARFNAEISSINELHQVEATWAALQAERPVLKQTVEIQRNRLAVLTGNDPSRFALIAPSTPLKLPEITGFEQPADLLRRRPDVIAAEQRVIAATDLPPLSRTR